MTKASFLSDSIAFKDISTGHNSAGNGGDGYNSGDIISSPSMNFQPYNSAQGASVSVSASDPGHHWDAGGTSVHADTTANQTNWVAADMSQSVYAGIGGQGGNDNTATGGNVQFDPSMETNLHLHVSDIVPV